MCSFIFVFSSFLLYLHINSISGSNVVKAVLNRKVELPCNLSENVLRNDVILVLWYKEGIPHPIYSLDARGGNIRTGNRVSSDELGKRGYFNLYGKPPVLQISPVELQDEGNYRCRIDFKRAPTINFEVQVHVIVPPGKPVIKNKYGSVLSKIAGPFDEGLPLALICESKGGSPLPKVTWLLDNSILDNTSREISGNVVKNELFIKSVDKSFLSARLRCQASNTNITEPVYTEVVIEIYLNPTSVAIIDKPLFYAGKTQELVCVSKGSRPRAKITWWLASKRLENAKEFYSRDDQTTSSKIRLKLNDEDHRKHLSCRSENPMVAASAIEDGYSVDVHYVPVVQLSISGNKESLSEGTQVFFDCRIRSNPLPYKIEWTFEHRNLLSDPSSGIIISNQSLIINSVKREHWGRYACVATNDVGEGRSQQVLLNVKYAPRCTKTEPVVFGAAKAEKLRLNCEMSANPKSVTFTWAFTNAVTGKTTSYNFANSMGKNQSYVLLRVRGEEDYGNFTCYGNNIVDGTSIPCIFTVVSAAPPSKLKNCSISNDSSTEILVSCEEGLDGGMKQTFHIEVYVYETNRILVNATSLKPKMKVAGLPPGTKVRILLYASNIKGKGEYSTYVRTTDPLIEKESLSSLFTTPVLTILIGIICGMLLVISLVVVSVKIRGMKRNVPRKVEVTTSSEKSSPSPEKDVFNVAENSEGKSPDIIPTTRCTTIADLSYPDIELDPTTVPEHYTFDFTNIRPGDHNMYISDNIPGDGELVLIPGAQVRGPHDLGQGSACDRRKIANGGSQESVLDRQRRGKHVEPPTVPLHKLNTKTNISNEQLDDDSGISAETPLMGHKLESVV